MRDVVVIGGGHNGVVCGAYLAAGGLDVEVIEANDRPGGCIWTETLDSGHRLELGAVDLSMIDEVAADLELERHGLRLLGRDTLVGAAFGGRSPLLFQSDLAASLAGMPDLSLADRDAYRQFSVLAGRALTAFDALPGVPPFAEVIRLAESLSVGVDLGRLLISSTESVLARRIDDVHLSSAIAMYGAHGQLPPWLPGTGLFSMLLPGSHGGSAYRVAGGTEVFIDAIVAALTTAGGSVRTGSFVTGIERSGDRCIVHLADGDSTETARVVSSLDVKRTTAMLADAPDGLVASAAAVRSGALNVGELKIDLALSAPAAITGGDADAALWLLQEQPDSLRTAFGEIVSGVLPTTPAMMWAAPSVLDPTSAPPGGGTVWMSAFVPARLRGREWDTDVEDEVTDNILKGFARITGIDVRPQIVDRRVVGPTGWEQRIGSPGGHPNHIDLTLDQLFGWRPPGVNGYRTDLPWLYLTGAGTFPGGGVSGTPGRNAAQAVLADLGSRPKRVGRWRREVKGLWDAFGLYRSMRRRA